MNLICHSDTYELINICQYCKRKYWQDKKYTKYENNSTAIFTFRETNSPINIGISIEIPFSMNSLYIADSSVSKLNSGSILNFIKDHFEESIPLLLVRDYIGLSRLLHLIY